ncbi:MAG: hypothetical protein M1305_05950 [Candidatus Marsarchaeota archaeon]|nr:hypothetical protein [Candidatus Marsarchaeota archaeon]
MLTDSCTCGHVLFPFYMNSPYCPHCGASTYLTILRNALKLVSEEPVGFESAEDMGFQKAFQDFRQDVHACGKTLSCIKPEKPFEGVHKHLTAVANHFYEVAVCLTASYEKMSRGDALRVGVLRRGYKLAANKASAHLLKELAQLKRRNPAAFQSLQLPQAFVEQL